MESQLLFCVKYQPATFFKVKQWDKNYDHFRRNWSNYEVLMKAYAGTSESVPFYMQRWIIIVLFRRLQSEWWSLEMVARLIE